jgi:2-methylcitrate dehydratase PrpD
MAFAPLIHVMPHAPLEGKFSLHYCLAVALLEGAVGLASFTPDKIADARIRSLIPRIAMEVDDDIRHDGEFATRVTVVTASGRRLERFVPLAMGKPARWFSTQRMQQKFLDCAETVLGPQGCSQAFDALRTLDSPAPVAKILSLLHTLTHPSETT